MFNLKLSTALKLAHKKKKWGFEKGYSTWNKGKHIQCNDALSIWRKNGGISNSLSIWRKNGGIVWNKGKKLSPKHAEICRKNRLIGLKKQQTMKEPTSIEKKLYEELKKRGLLFETQKLINGRFLVDAYIPSLNLIIEADGGYWHNIPKVAHKDKAENAYLIKCGYNLLRLSEMEINNTNFGERIG